MIAAIMLLDDDPRHDLLMGIINWGHENIDPRKARAGADFLGIALFSLIPSVESPQSPEALAQLLAATQRIALANRGLELLCTSMMKRKEFFNTLIHCWMWPSGYGCTHSTKMISGSQILRGVLKVEQIGATLADLPQLCPTLSQGHDS